MNKTMADQMIRKALDRIASTSGARIHRRRVLNELAKVIDAVIEMRLPSGYVVQVCVEVKRTLRPAHLPELEYVHARCADAMPEAKLLVVSEAITDRLALELRNRGMWFADMAGNLGVDLEGQVLLFITGGRTDETQGPPMGWRRSEQAAKLLFQLVRRGPEIRATYRDLVDATGISLGIVSKLFSAWREEELIRGAGRGIYRVLEPAKVLDYWCDSYLRQLSPKLLLGHYRSPYDDDFEQLLQEGLLPNDVVVGGEYAADVLTDYLRGSKLHLYVPEGELGQIRETLQLAPSRNGNIEIRRQFASNLAGHLAHRQSADIAHPALVYAELMAGDHRRLAETAVRIREEYLAWTLARG